MIIFVIKYFYFFKFFSSTLFSFFFALFWNFFSIYLLNFLLFFFHCLVILRFEYWYSICILLSLELIKKHYFHIFYHFYLAHFYWRKKFLLTFRQKFFFVFRWITGISPIFYFFILFIIFLHFCVSCFFYSFGLIVYWCLKLFVPKMASPFKKFFDSYVILCISKFVDMFLFLFSFLSIYRFFLFALFHFLTYIDLTVLQFLQRIVFLISEFIFYCKLYSWKFFHIYHNLRSNIFSFCGLYVSPDIFLII